MNISFLHDPLVSLGSAVMMVIASVYFVAGAYPREFFYSSKVSGHDPAVFPEDDQQREEDNNLPEEDGGIEAEIVITERKEF